MTVEFTAYLVVIPAHGGIYSYSPYSRCPILDELTAIWIPAFAGMTGGVTADVVVIPANAGIQYKYSLPR